MHKLSGFVRYSFVLSTLMLMSSSFPWREKGIPWTPELRLSWQDFSGRPDISANYLAATKTTIKTELIRLTSDSLIYEVTAYFNRELSWSKDKTSPDLLKHEQLHFDIAEWASRMVRKEYAGMDLTELERNGYRDLSIVFDRYGIVLDSINELYDKETRHGTLAEPQMRWLGKVSSKLESLKEFSEPEVVVLRRKKK